MIVMAEYELGEIEKKMAFVLNIPLLENENLSEYAKFQKMIEEKLHSINKGKRKYSTADFKGKLL